MTQRDSHLLTSFALFLGGMAMVYIGLQFGFPARVVILGAVVAILALILLAPGLYRFNVEVYQVKEKTWKAGWGKQWYAYVTVVAIADYLIYFLPKEFQQIAEIILLCLVVATVIMERIRAARRKKI